MLVILPFSLTDAGCGNGLLNGGAPVTSGCTMACKGNSTENCGGSNRLNVYQFGVVSSSSSSDQPSSSSSAVVSSSAAPVTTDQVMTSSAAGSTTTTPTSSSASSTATGFVPGWDYKGCYVDNKNGRILINGQPNSQTNTIERCIGLCQAAGYSVAGMEYGS